MQPTDTTPFAVAIPPDASAHGFYASPYLADAFAISLPADVVASPEQLARYVFENQPAWVNTLMGVRDTLVAGFGLKTAKKLVAPSADKPEKRIAIFKIYESNAKRSFWAKTTRTSTSASPSSCAPLQPRAARSSLPPPSCIATTCWVAATSPS